MVLTRTKKRRVAFGKISEDGSFDPILSDKAQDAFRGIECDQLPSRSEYHLPERFKRKFLQRTANDR